MDLAMELGFGDVGFGEVQLDGFVIARFLV